MGSLLQFLHTLIGSLHGGKVARRPIAGLEDLLADARGPREFLGDAHGIAVELLGKITSEGRARGDGEISLREIVDDAGRVSFFFCGPFALESQEGGGEARNTQREGEMSERNAREGGIRSKVDRENRAEAQALACVCARGKGGTQKAEWQAELTFRSWDLGVFSSLGA